MHMKFELKENGLSQIKQLVIICLRPRNVSFLIIGLVLFLLQAAVSKNCSICSSPSFHDDPSL